MSTKVRFEDGVGMAVDADNRFPPQAYEFLRDALNFAMKQRNIAPGKVPHVSGPDLLDSIRVLALNEFGPMVTTVFEEWGITSTADFGDMVFNLIDVGVFRQSEEDRREDFADVYTFEEAFLTPFRPKS